jgi:sulfite reductase alpha subunit-like flavoprotein
MVGPGTGLAPFRSILQQRKYSSAASGPLILFFGCRNKEKDFHCRSELEQLELEGQLKVISAFSRDQVDKV